MKTTIFSMTRTRGALCAIAALLATLPVIGLADPAPSGLRMMAIENRAHGKLLTSGRYVEAIEKISAHRDRIERFERHNNLCVAYTKTRDLQKAAAACEAALETREGVTAQNASYWSSNRLKLRDRAIALSNRGVLRAVTGDMDGAREDFSAAAKLSDELDEPLENLALIATAR